MSKWLIELAGVKITVNVKTDAAEDLVLTALSALRPKKINTAQGIRLVVNQQEKLWLLNDRSKDIERKIKKTGDLVYHLTDRIVFHIADKAENNHCLHAAAVANNEHALIIPANSGAGKSSFTTWLVANGFSYLTDELILIDEQRSVRGVGRPIQIKSHGIEAVNSLFLKPDLVFPGNFANAVTIDALGGKVSERESHQLAMMVFPKYRKGADYELNRLSSAEAGMSLMGNHVNARNLEGHGFRDMMAIIRETPCFSLEYGGFDKLPNDFDQQLKDMLASESL